LYSALLYLGAAQRQALQEAMRDEFEQAFLFCLAFMHCDNVEKVELPPSPPVIRKRQNHNGARPRRSEIRYKIGGVVDKDYRVKRE
jgi:hypothetical protein